MIKWLRRILIALVVVLAGAYLLLRTPDTDPAAMKAKYGGAPSQFLALGNGMSVHLRDEGPRDAPVIVLLHGSNADLHTWDPWTAQLSKSYRVIRFDQPGHGLTGPAPDGIYTPERIVDTIEQITTQLGVTRFALAGNSMGGSNALHYALAHPEKLTGLVLIDSGGAPQLAKEPGNIGFKIAQTPGLRNLMLIITPRALVEQSLSQSVFNQAIVTPAAVDRYWELLRYPGNRQATLDRFAGGWSVFDAGKLAVLKLPVLILWGAHDGLIAPDSAQWFKRTLPASSLIIYPDAGHLPMEEVAARSAGDLSAWLAVQGLAPKPG